MYATKKLSLKNEEEIKSFSDKQKSEEIFHQNTSHGKDVKEAGLKRMINNTGMQLGGKNNLMLWHSGITMVDNN